MSDYYQLLQVQRNADDDTIKKAYRKLARQYHPDSNRTHFADEHMKLINAAYEVLGDPLKRRQYDERLAEVARHTVTPVATVVEEEPIPERTAVNIGLVWIGITALLIIIVFSATLYTLRESLPAISLSLLPTSVPSRLPLLLPAATPTRLLDESPTLTARATDTLAPEPTATALRPTATLPPNTPTATVARPSPTPPRPTPVPTQAAYPPPASISPDTRIVRTEQPGGPAAGGTIVVSSGDGRIKVNLLGSGTLSEGPPSWSPFGLHIVFTEFNTGNLFVLDADGGLMTRVTSDALMRDSAPVWAPVGSLIAFQSIRRDAFAAGNFGAAKVFIVDFGSKQRRQISDQPGRDLSWSPDGQWLAYDVPVGPSSTVYIVNVDRPTQQYFFPTSAVRRMAWTQDSRQLIFQATTPQGTTTVFAATTSPVNVQPLTTPVIVVSPRGVFSDSASEGDYYPPVLSTVLP